jgi:hypothetical protein
MATEPKVKPKNEKTVLLAENREHAAVRLVPPGWWLEKYAGVAAMDVSVFCGQHGVLESVRAGIAIVEECFPSRKALSVFLDDDPEDAGQSIIVEVTTEQDVDEFLKTYNRCASLWAERIPTEGLSLMRLSYNLA